MDENHLEQSLCTMQDFAPGGSPPCPCVDFLGHPGGGLGFADALGVDGLRLCAVPCPVQALGKSGCAFAVELPCLVHDLGEIVLLHTVPRFTLRVSLVIMGLTLLWVWLGVCLVDGTGPFSFIQLSGSGLLS